jgi:transcriptional regulator with XRE-family HTH domain
MASRTLRLSTVRAKPKSEPEPEPESVSPPVQHDGRESPAHRFVRLLREKDGVDYRTTAEVARMLGVSSAWIRKIQRQGLLPPVPSKVTQLGKITIYLYTPEDVEIIRQYLVDRQSVYANTVSNRVESWEEVKQRRERDTQAADHQ